MRESPGTPSGEVRCPSCDNKGFFVYRRHPAGDGKVRNLCHCQSCDGTFTIEEDKTGKVTCVSR